MHKTLSILLLGIVLIFFVSCKKEKPADTEKFQLVEIKAGNRPLTQGSTLQDMDVNSFFYLNFSEALDESSLRNSIKIEDESTNQSVSLDFKLENNGKTLVIRPLESFEWLTT